MKKKNSKNVIKAGIWYTITNFLTKGAIFLTTPIFTRLMSRTDIGAFANLTSWFQVLASLTTFDMAVSLGIARFDYREELNRYTSSVLVYGTCITALFYGIVLLNMDFFCSLFSIRPYALHIIFIYMLVYPSLQMYQSLNMFQYRYVASTIVSLFSVIISVGAALFMTIRMEEKLYARTVGYFVPLTLLCLGIYVYLMIHGKGVSMKYFKYAVAISFPMIWHALALQLLAAGDRIIITRYLGEEKNALYSVAYTCSLVASVLWNSMNSAWSPWSTERMDAGETEQIRKASRPYILLYSAAVLALLLVTPELLWIMGGEGYIQAKYVMPPVVVGCVCQFVYSLYINAEFYLKKQKRIAAGTLSAAALNVGLNIIFVPRFGYVVAAYTTLFGYLCLFVFHFVSLNLLKKGHWYDGKFNWMVVGIFLLVIPVVNFLYSHTTLRYISVGVLLLCGAVVAYRYRDFIITFLKKKLLGRNTSQQEQTDNNA